MVLKVLNNTVFRFTVKDCIWHYLRSALHTVTGSQHMLPFILPRPLSDGQRIQHIFGSNAANALLDCQATDMVYKSDCNLHPMILVPGGPTARASVA
jgi:hypothetical protein